MEILSINSPEFQAYGKIVDNVDFTQLLEALKDTPLPEGVEYQPSVEALENTDTYKQLNEISFGEMPIQIGYTNGHCSYLNAFEYHKTSEVVIGTTDAILILGLRSEIEEDFTYDTAKAKAFLLPAGTPMEIYATTLHYAPCGVAGNGYKMAIVLPRGTNYPIKKSGICESGEDRLMTASNKWLIGHPEGGLDDGCFIGLKGENLCVL